MTTHNPDCQWERTTTEQCQYRATHHFCPHPEHACNCTPSLDERDAVKAAATALEQAIEALWAIHDPDRPAGAMVVDAVLVLGVQHVEDDGDRVGYVEVFPRGGSQPSYVTRGMLGDGLKLLDEAQDLPQGG